MSIKINFISFILLFFNYSVLANNSSYITLSNILANIQEMEVIANNIANTNTTGYEEDTIIMNNYDVLQNKRKANSFVISKGMYKPGNMGGLITTNRPFDLAIIGDNQFFKILTPRGPRYTLNGNIYVNSNNILVTSEGYSFMSINNDIIELPAGTSDFTVAGDGTIFNGTEEVARLGVFRIESKYTLTKEGNSLYLNKGQEIALEEYTVLSGTLRSSNVNPSRVMADMIEAQHSVGMTNTIMNDINELEKNAVSRVLKQ